jgi:hypothetical protein
MIASEGPGGVEAHGTVTLSSSAPNTALSGTQHGVYVVLTSNPPAVSFNSNYPDNPYYSNAGLFIPAGATQGRFNVIPIPVASETTLVLSASVQGTAPATGTFRVLPPMLKTVRLDQAEVVGGTKVNGNATFDAPPASTGAVVINLTSSDPSVVSVPATVVLEQGKTVEPFVAQTSAVSVRKDVTISASYAGMGSNSSVGWSTKLSVALPGLAEFGGGFACAPPCPYCSKHECMGRIKLTGPAGPGGAEIHVFTDGNPSISIPAIVTIPQGQGQGIHEFYFPITVNTITGSSQTIKISASYNGKSKLSEVEIDKIRKWDLVITKVVLKDRFGNVMTSPADDTPSQLCATISDIGGAADTGYYSPNQALPPNLLRVSFLVHSGGPASAGKEFDVPVSFAQPDNGAYLVTGNVESCFPIAGMPAGSTMDVTLTADPKNQVDESNEGNNVYKLTIKRPAN